MIIAKMNEHHIWYIYDINNWLTYQNMLWCEGKESFLSKDVSGITSSYSNIPHTFACSVTVLQSVARYSMFLHDREL